MIEAPDRSGTVAWVCEQHPEAFGSPAETNDARRLDLLQEIIIPLLNGADFDWGSWGVLVKDDQGGKIPCDIIVWRPTLEHFDIMTGTGACWIPRGRVDNPHWRWQAVESPQESAPAGPSEPSLPAPTSNETITNCTTQIIAAIERLRDDVKEVNKTLNNMRHGVERSVPAALDRIIKMLQEHA